jgi:hypothetical protein
VVIYINADCPIQPIAMHHRCDPVAGKSYGWSCLT